MYSDFQPLQYLFTCSAAAYGGVKGGRIGAPLSLYLLSNGARECSSPLIGWLLRSPLSLSPMRAHTRSCLTRELHSSLAFF